MFLFAEYKKLTRDTRSMATRYWAEVVKLQLGADCPNQILAAHLDSDVTAEAGWSDNSSRYWNKMLRGEPAGRESKIDQTESLLPGTKAVLLHPIWFLVDTDVHDDSLINRVLLSLPPEIHSKLFNADNNGVMRRKTLHRAHRIKLFSTNSLDALTCFLALAIEARSKRDLNDQSGYEMSFLKLFLRLAVLTELEVIYQPLYKRISEIFNQSPVDYDRLKIITLKYHLPLQIVPSDWVNIEEMANAYLDVLKSAVNIGLVADSQKEKLLFLYSLNNTSFRDIQSDFTLLTKSNIDKAMLNRYTQETIDRFKFYLEKS